MTIDMRDLLDSILKSLDRIDYIKEGDLPDIDLYAEQIITIMGRKLKHSTRDPKNDKILTKTMINNYTKNSLLPPPYKKRYGKDHIIMLLFIFYFKNIMSISDIHAMLNPLSDRFFGEKSDLGLEKIYSTNFKAAMSRIDELKDDVIKRYKESDALFPEAEGEDKELLQVFSFICQLSFDVYLKQLLIEKLIDGQKD